MRFYKRPYPENGKLGICFDTSNVREKNYQPSLIHIKINTDYSLSKN